MKKVISVFLAVLMVVTAFPLTGFSENNFSETEFIDNTSVYADNALSDIIAEAIDNENNTRDENDGYGIFSVDLVENSATVNLSAPDDSTVVVAVYDETDMSMITSGKADVDSDADYVTVSMTEYSQADCYILKAFLIDNENVPVCANYVNLENTKEYKEFFEKDIDSFDSELVINLDGSDETNFAVVAEKAKIVKKTENKNIVVTDDYENGTYVVENADDEISSLSSGDILYYVYGDDPDDYILTKIDKIETENGLTVIKADDDCEMHELFQYVDIDTSKGTSSVSRARSADADINVGKDKSFVLNENNEEIKFGNENCSLTLKVTGNITFHVKFQYDIKIFGKDYWLFEYWIAVDANANAKFNANVSFSESVVLVDKTFPVLTGLDIAFKLTATVAGSASLTVEGDIVFTMKYGAKQTSSGGKEKIEKKPSITLDIIVEGDFTIDFIPEITTSFCILKVLYADFDVNVTFNINGKLFVPTSKDEKERHDCYICIAGDISANVGFRISVKYGLKKSSLETIVKIETKSKKHSFGEYYLSISEGAAVEFGWGKCPHIKYKVTVFVTDASGNAKSDVVVNTEYITGADGKTEIYFKKGTYVISAITDDGKIASGSVTVIDEDTEIELTLALNNVTVYAKDNTGNMLSGVIVNGKHQTDNSGCVVIQLPDGDHTITGVDADGITASEKITISGEDVFVELVFFKENQQIPESAVRYGNSYYQLYNNCSTWEEAQAYSKSLGGHLAVISDDGENSFLYMYIISLGCKSAYFGFSDSVREGEWKWVDGFTSSYVNWGGREPNAENSYEDYGMFYYKYSDGKWNDGDFGRRTVNSGKYYICEWDLSAEDSEKEYEDLIAIGNCGDNLEWQLYDDGELKITGTGEMKDYTEDSVAPWYAYRESIKKITFGENVTTIGKWAFKDCAELTEVIIPENVTECRHAAFENCTGIKKAVIPESINCLPSSIFRGCTSLSEVILPDGLQQISTSVFYDCTSLEKIEMPAGLNVIDDFAFYGCTALREIVIPGNITEIRINTFGNCSSLERIELPEGVELISSSSFSGCSSLKEIVIPESVKEIQFEAFHDCSSLETVYYSGAVDDWEKIEIKDYHNDALFDATLVCNYEYSSCSSTTHNALKDSQTVVKTETVEKAVVGNWYLMIVVRDENAKDLLAHENLLYIDQKTATGETLVFEYYLADNQVDYAVLIISCSNDDLTHEHTPGEWEVVTDAQIGIVGLEQQKCVECGEVLDERIIPALDEVTLGDVNGDGKITAADARLALRISAQIEIPTETQIIAADLTGDGKVTAADARKILRISAGLEVI